LKRNIILRKLLKSRKLALKEAASA
jgi:hypothetical protein